MARHNLAGWMRDVKSLLRDGTDEELEELYVVMEDVNVRLEDWLDVGHRADTSDVESDGDDTYDTADGGEDDVDCGDTAVREEDAPRARRPASRSEAIRAATGSVGPVVSDVPRSVRGTTEPEQPDLRGGAVGSPCGLMRTSEQSKTSTGTAFAPQESRSVPRGTQRTAPEPARTRKGVSRGKKRTTKKRR